MWYVYLSLAAFPALILFAALAKYYEVVRASYWSSAPGRIVLSTTQAKSVLIGGPNSEETELRTFARIEYEYQVAGRSYRGNRVSIGEDRGNFEVAETVARYPVGKAVTVYYNPNRRNEAVLERELPSLLWKGVAILVVVLSGVIIGGVLGIGRLAELMRAIIPRPHDAPVVTACIIFAVITALMIYAIQRQAVRARSWPVVQGSIIRSDVRRFSSYSTDKYGQGRWTTHFRPDIVYRYEVAGVGYIGDKVPIAGRTSASTDFFARRGAARYPEGRTVAVHFNPDNPAESVLDPRFGVLWLLWLMPLGLLALGYLVAH